MTYTRRTWHMAAEPISLTRRDCNELMKVVREGSSAYPLKFTVYSGNSRYIGYKNASFRGMKEKNRKNEEQSNDWNVILSSPIPSYPNVPYPKRREKETKIYAH